MKCKYLLMTLLIVLLGDGCRPSAGSQHELQQSRGKPRGSLKGFHQIEQNLQQNVFDERFRLMSVRMELASGDIVGLMGAFAGSGSENRFQNGVPNALNMFLWDSLMASLAQTIAEGCQTQQSHRTPQESFVSLLGELCQNPSSVVYSELWETLVGFEAPDEKEAWLAEVTRSKEPLSPEGVLYSLFMNPHYLLER